MNPLVLLPNFLAKRKLILYHKEKHGSSSNRLRTVTKLKKKKYNSTFKRWANFCSKRSVNSLHPYTINITELLTEEFKKKFSHNSLDSVRSALCHCLPYDVINRNTEVTTGFLYF